MPDVEMMASEPDDSCEQRFLKLLKGSGRLALPEGCETGLPVPPKVAKAMEELDKAGWLPPSGLSAGAFLVQIKALRLAPDDVIAITLPDAMNLDTFDFLDGLKKLDLPNAIMFVPCDVHISTMRELGWIRIVGDKVPADDPVALERQRILSRLEDAKRAWDVEPNVEVREAVQGAFDVFSLCLTHAGVTMEEAVAAARERGPLAFNGSKNG